LWLFRVRNEKSLRGMARRRPRPATTKRSEDHSTQDLSLYIEEDWPPPASIHWLRRKGDKVRAEAEVAQVTLLGPHPIKRVLAPCSGVLEELLVPEGTLAEEFKVSPGRLRLAVLSYCTHPYVIHDLCSGCGEKVKPHPPVDATSSSSAHAANTSSSHSSALAATSTAVNQHKLHRVFVPGGRHISINTVSLVTKSGSDMTKWSCRGFISPPPFLSLCRLLRHPFTRICPRAFER